MLNPDSCVPRWLLPPLSTKVCCVSLSECLLFVFVHPDADSPLDSSDSEPVKLGREGKEV